MKNKLVLSVAVAAAVALLAFFAISKAAPATDCPSTTPVDCSGFVQCTGSHQTLPISNDQAPQGTEEDCRNTNLCAGQVLWHFVLTQPQNTSGILKVNFTNAGEFCVDSYTQGGSGNLFWAVITSGADTLTAFSTDACGGELNLSHVCGNSSPPPTPTPPPTNAITACKFYDSNGNGVNDSEPPLAGWPMTIDPLDGGVPPSATQLTASNGCVTWTNLVDGHYTISEGTPNETNWVHSTPVSQSVDVDPSNPNPTVSFGNYCLRGSGGLSIGFWSNKNGQKLETPADLTFLCSLNLVNASGSHFCPGTTAALATWLLSANASNMAYMLSAQLAAMELNVRHGFTDGNAFDLCSGKTINALMAHANSLLVPPGNYTPAGNPLRSAEEADKNCLDALNNGGSVIPATPCPRTFGS